MVPARLAVAVVAIVAAGCALRRSGPQAYRLEPAPRSHILHPPGAAPVRKATGQVIRLHRARPRGLRGECEIVAGPAWLRWQGRSAIVELQPEALAEGAEIITTVSGAGAPRQLSAQAPYDSSWVVRLHEELIRQEGRCLAPDGAAPLTRGLIESIPASSSHLFFLLHGDFRQTGWFDVEPPYILRSVAPLLKPGVDRYARSADVRGYETALYRVEPREGGGVRVELESVEWNEGGRIRRAAVPAIELLRLPGQARYVRMFFRAWTLGVDRRLVLLAAPTRPALETATARFDSEPEAYCTGEAREAACISVPKEMVISVELRVWTNHGNVLVPVGGTVGDALRSAGVKDVAAAVKTLAITRPFRGRPCPVAFDRSARTILGLVLIGGEELRW